MNRTQIVDIRRLETMKARARPRTVSFDMYRQQEWAAHARRVEETNEDLSASILALARQAAAGAQP